MVDLWTITSVTYCCFYIFASQQSYLVELPHISFAASKFIINKDAIESPAFDSVSLLHCFLKRETDLPREGKIRFDRK